MSLANGLLNTAYAIIERVPWQALPCSSMLRRLPCDAKALLTASGSHFLACWPDRDAYAMLPVDVQTFVESPTFSTVAAPCTRR